MSLRTGGREALEDTETPNPDVLAGLKMAYLAADGWIVNDILNAWRKETGHDYFFDALDAEIRAYVVPAAEVITPEMRAMIDEAATFLGSVDRPFRLIEQDRPLARLHGIKLRAIANVGAS